jgi:hypothetical protein
MPPQLNGGRFGGLQWRPQTSTAIALCLIRRRRPRHTRGYKLPVQKVVGHIESKPEPPSNELDLNGWRLSLSSGRSYAVPAFADLDVFELHFFTEVGMFLEEDT